MNFRTYSSILFACIVSSAIATAATSAKDCASESHYPQIQKAELSKMIEQKKAFVIDVNSKERFGKGHVPTAIHFESSDRDFAAKLPKDKDAPIVAYCGGPKCTAWKKAAEEACKLGYTNIRHFKDGISGWEKKDAS